MADVFISELGVPRKYRNGKIYSGNSFNVTNQYQTSSEGGVGQRHIETGRVVYTVTDSRTITIPFVESFNTTPVLVELKVYRVEPLISGKWVIQDVLYYLDKDSFSDEDGFEIFIDDSESMEGVILNYNFTE